jgi:hypothetical protein
MAATHSPPIPGDDDNDQQQQRPTSQRRQSEMPSNFVLGRPHTGPGRNNTNHSQQSQRFANGGASYVHTTDAEHNLALFDHLSTDFANLLNRTDISDCFLNVKGITN